MSFRLTRVLLPALLVGLGLGLVARQPEATPAAHPVRCTVEPLDPQGLDSLYTPFLLSLTAGVEGCLVFEDFGASFENVCQFLDERYPDYESSGNEIRYIFIATVNGIITVCLTETELHVQSPDGEETALVTLSQSM